MRQRSSGIEQPHVDPPLRQVLDGGSSAAIRHQTKARAGFPLKENAGDMRGRTGDRRRRLAGIRPKPIHKLPQIARRRGVAGDDQQRTLDQQRDRLEILHHVVVEWVNGSIRDMAAPISDGNRIAVGCSARRTAGADAAGGPIDVFDHDGLAERHTHALGRVPPDRRIEFRTGINVGDIISDGNDIFGDGVNVAARLEALAEPGGIMVSRVVYEQVRDKLNFGFEDMGEQTVKNIARPISMHRVSLSENGSAGAISPSGHNREVGRFRPPVDCRPAVRQY